jgi:hypothetical protein
VCDIGNYLKRQINNYITETWYFECQVRFLPAFDACFVQKLAPLADDRNSFFHRISIVTLDSIKHLFNVVNSYLALRNSLSAVVNATQQYLPQDNRNRRLHQALFDDGFGVVCYRTC